MKNKTSLTLTSEHHALLQAHLFPGDGLEAAAIMLCSRCGQTRQRFLVESVIPVPYSDCGLRTETRLSWPGEYIEKALEQSEVNENSIILVHSHPLGFPSFSDIDDLSDQKTVPSLQHGAASLDTLHGSAIMLPNGTINARLYDQDMTITKVEQITVVGENIQRIDAQAPPNIMPFTSQMTNMLSGLTACIVGVSGTGSLTAEMLARLGVGHIILIDFDRVEYKNLNRIPYATLEDAQSGEFKTKVLRRAIKSHHPNTLVTTVEKSISDRTSIIAASDADTIFSCVDSIEGRHYGDLIAQAFLAPLIDMGVTIPTRAANSETRVVSDVLGRIDYVFPGGPTLQDRAVVTPEGLRAEYLRRVDESDYQKQRADGYIKGQIEEAPSVISLNMRAASTAVNEWICRLFQIRHENNEQYARTIFSLADCEEEYHSTSDFEKSEAEILARGLRYPLLDIPALRRMDIAA